MAAPASPLHVVVSHCLLGGRVRFDGRDKGQAWLSRVPAALLRCAPVCPEVAAGLGTPREPMTLVGRVERPRLRGNDSGRDFTAALETTIDVLLAAFAVDPPELFLLKARSPSCGVGTTSRSGRPGFDGLFAERIAQAFPRTPRADETMLLNFEGRSQIFVQLVAERRAKARETQTLMALEAWLATLTDSEAS